MEGNVMNEEMIKEEGVGAEAQETSTALPTDVSAAQQEESKFMKYEEPTFWKLQLKRVKKYRKVLWFIIPAAVFSLIFSYIPMLGLLFSFKGADFSLMFGTPVENLFRGSWTFQNYLDIFVDASFAKGVGNTLLINVLRLVICFPLSIFIAVQLSELKNQTLSKVILIIICIPNFLSWAIVVSTWSGLLDSQGGALNQILVNMGIIDADYFLMGKNHMFKFFVIFLSAWKGAGWGSIMFYAAIMAIDKSFYESATLEGANRLQKMWYLTIPSITPTIALMLVMNFSGMMNAGFEQIYTMMQLSAELEDTQMTLDVYLYNISVVNRNNVPFATALGVFNGLIALALMIIGNKITTKTLHRSLW